MMPTDVAMIKGQPAMMYCGTTPWDGLGQKLSQPATAAEAIVAANLNWEVVKVPVYLKRGPRYRVITNRFATVREDSLMQGDPTALGIVGSSYQIMQNVEAFSWFDAIVGEGKAVYHTAGALGDGQRIWILAKLPEPLRITGDDTVEKFLLLSNSHDGSSSVLVKFAPIRFACWNSLMTPSVAGSRIRIRHTTRLRDELHLAQVNWDRIQREFTRLGTTFQNLTQVSMTEARLAEYLCAVFPLSPVQKDDRARRYVHKARSQARFLFDAGTGNDQPGTAGTLWAAYNGVTEFIDYAVTPRGPDRHLESIWFGDGSYQKARAYRIAVEKSKVWKN